MKAFLVIFAIRGIYASYKIQIDSSIEWIIRKSPLSIYIIKPTSYLPGVQLVFNDPSSDENFRFPWTSSNLQTSFVLLAGILPELLRYKIYPLLQTMLTMLPTVSWYSPNEDAMRIVAYGKEGRMHCFGTHLLAKNSWYLLTKHSFLWLRFVL